MTAHQSSRWGRVAVLAPALLVAAGAVATTAHGAYEVAVAAHVPPGIAWLYPLILDGLALVAYAATHRLRGAGNVYAWLVVVISAGLSGLAQATYLASGPALDTSPALRFGVGAWPAVAGAVAAHLVYLLSARHPVVEATSTETSNVAHDLLPGRSTPRPVPAGPTVQEWVNTRQAAVKPPPAREVVANLADQRERRTTATTLATSGAHTTVTGDQEGDTIDHATLAELVANKAGRKRVARELGVSEHKARQLLATHGGG